MSCCPISSEPALAVIYEPKGKEVNIDGLTCYAVGSGDKAIIVYYDIFGFNGGRIRLICDQLADAGFYVLLPDHYHGDAWPVERPIDIPELMKWLKPFPWVTSLKNDSEKVLSYLHTKKIASIGSLGFCAGAYAVFHLSGIEDGKIKCGASAHPSLQLAGNYGETPDELAENVKCPQLWYPAGDDLDFYKPNGSVYEILMKKYGDQNDYEEFKDVNHGWVPRGDLSNPVVADAVKKAMDGFIQFFKKHM